MGTGSLFRQGHHLLVKSVSWHPFSGNSRCGGYENGKRPGKGRIERMRLEASFKTHWAARRANMLVDCELMGLRLSAGLAGKQPKHEAPGATFQLQSRRGAHVGIGQPQ